MKRTSTNQHVLNRKMLTRVMMRRVWSAARPRRAAAAWGKATVRTTRTHVWKQFSTSGGDGVDAEAKEEEALAKQNTAAERHRSSKRWKPAKYRLSIRDLEAFELFKQENGHLVIPIAFEVPAEWPSALHDLRLGQVVNTVRMSYKEGTLSVDDTQQLDEMGFVFDVREHRWYNETLPSLMCFKTEFGDFPIPQPFVVPSDDARWPAHLWGNRLGALYNTLRMTLDKLTARRRAELADIGFPLDPTEDG